MSGELMTDINGKEWITCECGQRIPAEWGEDACPACMQEAKEALEGCPECQSKDFKLATIESVRGYGAGPTVKVCEECGKSYDHQ